MLAQIEQWYQRHEPGEDWEFDDEVQQHLFPTHTMNSLSLAVALVGFVVWLFGSFHASVEEEAHLDRTIGPGNSITDPSESLMLVASCVELAVAYLWLKLWTRTTKGKLSSTGISASFMKPKRPRGMPVFLEKIPGIIAR